MGGHFARNIALRGPTQAQTVAFLRKLERDAVVAPTVAGYTVLCDAETEAGQGLDFQALTLILSEAFQCVAFACSNYKDSVLEYLLYDKGVFLDAYNSCPGMYDAGFSYDALDGNPFGNAKTLCATFGKQGREAEIERWLRWDRYALIRNEETDTELHQAYESSRFLVLISGDLSAFAEAFQRKTDELSAKVASGEIPLKELMAACERRRHWEIVNILELPEFSVSFTYKDTRRDRRNFANGAGIPLPDDHTFRYTRVGVEAADDELIWTKPFDTNSSEEKAI